MNTSKNRKNCKKCLVFTIKFSDLEKFNCFPKFSIIAILRKTIDFHIFFSQTNNRIIHHNFNYFQNY